MEATQESEFQKGNDLLLEEVHEAAENAAGAQLFDVAAGRKPSADSLQKAVQHEAAALMRNPYVQQALALMIRGTFEGAMRQILESTPEREAQNPALDIKLGEMDFSARLLNCLESDCMKTNRDIVVRTAEDLLDIRNFGVRTLRELKKKLAGKGLRIGIRLPKNS